MTLSSEVAVTRRRPGLLVALFTLTIFTSALLLFFVQPLYTRLVLPQIGGAAAVWTTAMLFFQTVLIGGYLYAHLISRHLAVGAQIAVHLALLLLALMFLPLAVPGNWAYDAGRPVVLQTLWLYALGVGLPFAVLSANAPLIQAWYRQSGGPSADDPYFLYGASNLGSLIALLAFPLAAEPLFGVTDISVGWSVGFLLLGPMLLLSGLAAHRGGPVAVVAPARPADAAPLRWRAIGYWAFLAFLPSSLMLSVTTKISTDLGSFPLVWVVPLALYLLTFVLAFAARSPLTAARLRRIFPLALALLVFFALKPAVTLVHFGLLLVAFLLAGLLAHRLLYEARPAAQHLTVFYLVMSVGGALGGIFNSILAPLLFDRMIELAVTVALIALLLLSRPAGRTAGQTAGRPARQLALGLMLGALASVLLPLPELPIDARTATYAVMLAVLGAGVVLFRRLRLTVVTAVVTVLALTLSLTSDRTVFQDRSFFGLHLVVDHDALRTYSNGTTIHGAQLHDDPGPRPTPVMYYHPDGLIAEVFNGPKGRAADVVGIVGLGIGSLACYGQPGQERHFYEIDQKVVDIALDPALFTFMTACGQDAALHLGDARIVLERQNGLAFDLLLLDAYSSDAIPVHLVTVEAVALYLERLKPEGLLVFHISNRFYDLSRPLATIAEALGLAGRVASRSAAEATAVGDTASTVLVLARSEAALGAFASDPRWQPLPEPRVKLWTDDHANVLSALR